MSEVPKNKYQPETRYSRKQVGIQTVWSSTSRLFQRLFSIENPKCEEDVNEDEKGVTTDDRDQRRPLLPADRPARNELLGADGSGGRRDLGPPNDGRRRPAAAGGRGAESGRTRAQRAPDWLGLGRRGAVGRPVDVLHDGRPHSVQVAVLLLLVLVDHFDVQEIVVGGRESMWKIPIARGLFT